MDTEIAITLNQKAQDILAAPGGVPLRVMRAIEREMDKQMELTASAVVKNRMSEPRKGPISLDKLRVETGRLRRSMMRGGEGNISRPATFDGGSTIEGSIGTNVRYAAVHEHNPVTRKTRATRERVTQNFFGKRRTTERLGFQTAGNYPPRRPIGRTVDERRQIFVAAISHAIVTASQA